MLLVIHSRADLGYQCSQINSERQTRGLSRLTETAGDNTAMLNT